MLYGEDISANSVDKDVSLKKLFEISGIDPNIQNANQTCHHVFSGGEISYWCRYKIFSFN